jgi:hypothetical protein
MLDDMKHHLKCLTFWKCNDTHSCMNMPPPSTQKWKDVQCIQLKLPCPYWSVWKTTKTDLIHRKKRLCTVSIYSKGLQAWHSIHEWLQAIAPTTPVLHGKLTEELYANIQCIDTGVRENLALACRELPRFSLALAVWLGHLGHMKPNRTLVMSRSQPWQHHNALPSPTTLLEHRSMT